MKSINNLQCGIAQTFIAHCCRCSVAKSRSTLGDTRTAACQASLSFNISWSLLKLISIESMMPSNHLILCSLLLWPLIFPSIRVFSNESAHIRCQSIGASASTSVFPMNIQGWFPLGLTGLISLLFKGLSRVFSSTAIWKPQSVDSYLAFFQC